MDLEKFLIFFKISRFFPRHILAEIQFLRGRANRADIKNFRAIRAEAKNASGRVGSGWPFFGPYGPRAGRADGLWPDPPLGQDKRNQNWPCQMRYLRYSGDFPVISTNETSLLGLS